MELVCLLLTIVVALDVATREVDLPYPVPLVLSGLAVSLIPELPHRAA